MAGLRAHHHLKMLLGDRPGFAVCFQRSFSVNVIPQAGSTARRSRLLFVFRVSSARLRRGRYRLYMCFLTVSVWPTPRSCSGGDGVFAIGDAADAIVGSSDSNILFSPYRAPNDTSVPSTSAPMAATSGPFLADLLYAILSRKNRAQPIATCDSDSGGLEAGAVSVWCQAAIFRIMTAVKA